MIGFYVNKYCKDDISLIENYEQAINDKTQTWDCHHRLEIDLGLSADELKEQGKYLNVTASELIFLTHSEHIRLHQAERMKDPKERQKASEKNKGENHPMWNKHRSEETKKKLSDIQKKRFKDPKERQKVSNRTQGEKNGMYGTHPTWMNNGITRVFPKTQEEIEHYLELGYDFGRIYKRK